LPTPYEAIKQGEAIEEADIAEEIPAEVQEVTQTFLQHLYELMRSQFEDESRDIQEVCSSWVEEIKAREHEVITQWQRLKAEFEQVQRQLQERESQLQTLQVRAMSHEGTIEELRLQLQSKDAERETQEIQRIELSQHLGSAEERLKWLTQELERSRYEVKAIDKEKERVSAQIERSQQQERESLKTIGERDKEIALLTAKFEALER